MVVQVACGAVVVQWWQVVSQVGRQEPELSSRWQAVRQAGV